MKNQHSFLAGYRVVILAILIAAGCTPSRRPHDRARGTRGIAVESAGKAVISITAHNAARPAGSPREDLFSAAKSAAWQVLAETRRTPRQRPRRPQLFR